ncbi:MAG: hypothetical protein EHM41_22710 [Chloroflexi bacterium]|nr:MAG: hypothetical protein EHM41_22710 [Chloroflexota bacterium]
MEIRIEIPDEQVAVIRKAFRNGQLSDGEIQQKFAQLALNAWINWISGSKRYNSLTDQYMDWIEDCYTSLLSENEAPSLDRLYNAFNIPYGQAQYIARVLNNKTMTRWRQKAICELKRVMAERLDDADKWVRTGREEANLEILVDHLAFLELKMTWERLFRDKREEFLLPRSYSVGNVCAVSIPAKCFRLIYESIEG